MRQVALSYVVLHNWTVSQHAPEMMHDLGLVPRMIPTACLREERICNQGAHQGTEPDEEVQSLQNYTKARDIKLLEFCKNNSTSKSPIVFRLVSPY